MQERWGPEMPAGPAAPRREAIGQYCPRTHLLRLHAPLRVLITKENSKKERRLEETVGGDASVSGIDSGDGFLCARPSLTSPSWAHEIHTASCGSAPPQCGEKGSSLRPV